MLMTPASRTATRPTKNHPVSDSPMISQRARMEKKRTSSQDKMMIIYL